MVTRCVDPVSPINPDRMRMTSRLDLSSAGNCGESAGDHERRVGRRRRQAIVGVSRRSGRRCAVLPALPRGSAVSLPPLGLAEPVAKKDCKGRLECSNATSEF